MMLPDNYFSEEEIKECKNNLKIIHFTTCMLNIRPWCEGSKHSYAWMFDKYKAMSPWADKQRTKANFDAGEYKVIKSILSLPSAVAYRLLGLIHAYIRPILILVKAKLK